jgi:hypothetical protein
VPALRGEGSMTMSNYPGFATVQVRTELSLVELMALYWDALVDKVGYLDFAQGHIMNASTSYTNSATVKDLVRQWLTWYGERSVECGPRNDYPETEGFEARLKVIVAKAYKIVY